MEIIIKMILGFVAVAIIMAIFPSVGAWIEGGTKGVREYKKNKKINQF